MNVYASEQEQLDAIKRWFKDYGFALIVGLVIGIGGLSGYRYWQNQQQVRSEASAQIFQHMISALAEDDVEQTRDYAGQLRQDYPHSPYADLSRLVLARLAINDDEPALAKQQLQTLIANSRDASLVQIAQARLARLLLIQDQPQQALLVLADAKSATADQDGFAPLFAELRGDAHVQLSELTNAVADYEQAIFGYEAVDQNRAQLVRMKLDNVDREAG